MFCRWPSCPSHLSTIFHLVKAILQNTVVSDEITTSDDNLDRLVACPCFSCWHSFSRVRCSNAVWRGGPPRTNQARIGHFVEAQILEAIEVDYIDESEVLTMADEDNHINKRKFTVPFVCGCRNLGEALVSDSMQKWTTTTNENCG